MNAIEQRRIADDDAAVLAVVQKLAALRRQTCKPEKVGEHFCHTISGAHLRLWEEYHGDQPDEETLAGLVDLAATTLAVIDSRIAAVFGVLAKPVKLVTAEAIDLLVESVIAGMQRLKALKAKESGDSGALTLR